MLFNNKNLFIALLSLCTFQTYAAQCTAETLSKNKLNNFILLNQQTKTEVPKAVSVTIDSPDGYLRTSVQSNFGQCGELLGGHMKEVKTSTNTQTVFTATTEVQLNKTEFGWHVQLDSNGTIADKSSHKTTQVYRQTLGGRYLLDDNGIISHVVNRSIIAATKPEDKDKIATSNIEYIFNSSGLVVSAKSTGNMAIDNSTIVYSYDDHNRLIKIQSPSSIEEYAYDNEGREVSVSKTQTYFTIEKKLTTCEKWDPHGECTRANIDITITPMDRTGKQYIDKHHAVMTAKYEY